MTVIEKVFNFANSTIGDTMVFEKDEIQELAKTLMQYQQSAIFAEVVAVAIKSQRSDLVEYLNNLLTNPETVTQEFMTIHGKSIENRKENEKLE